MAKSKNLVPGDLSCRDKFHYIEESPLEVNGKRVEGFYQYDIKTELVRVVEIDPKEEDGIIINKTYHANSKGKAGTPKPGEIIASSEKAMETLFKLVDTQLEKSTAINETLTSLRRVFEGADDLAVTEGTITVHTDDSYEIQEA